MGILHDKFIFVHMHKTGGNSIRKFISDYVPDSVETLEAHLPMAQMLGIAKGQFSFGFIRNPFDWYVSLWAKSYKDEMGFGKFLKTDIRQKLPLGWTLPGTENNANIGSMTFRYWHAFFDLLPETPFPHVVKLADKILKLEDGLGKELERIFSECIFELDSKQKVALHSMERLNTSDHLAYQEYYDDELIDLVQIQDRYIMGEFDYQF